MANYFRNLEETMSKMDPDNVSRSKKIKFWMSSHLRVIWSLVMMFILFFFCIWISLQASRTAGDNTIIEHVVPEIQQAGTVDQKLEDAAKSVSGGAPAPSTQTAAPAKP